MAVGSTLLAERYELGRVLGGGRVGEVWEARDRMLGRRVAVKVAHARLAQDAAFNDGFLRAVQEAAAIEHPGTVAIHDAGSAGGTPFVVMEYVEGRTLREVLRDVGPLPVPRATRIATELASVLAAAHARGLTHGGLHAGNAFFTPAGQVKLADFGLARLTAGVLTAPVGPVPAREVRPWDPRQGPVGEAAAADGDTDAPADTPEPPAAPQPAGAANGSAPVVDAPAVAEAVRADLVALGGLLYELLSGRPPAQAERRQLRASRPDLPPDLDGVVRNALASRYRSAVELREALRLGGQQPAPDQATGRPAAPRQPRPAVPATHAERVRALTAQPGPSVRPWVLLAALIIALVVAGWSAAGVLAFQQPLWSAGAGVAPTTAVRPAPPMPTQSTGPTTTVAPSTAAPTTAAGVVASPTNRRAGKAVPRVSGLHVEAAIARLAAAGTPAGSVWRQRSADVAKDVVIQTIPPAGGHLIKGDRVVVVVSNGTDRDPVSTAVPAGSS